MPELPLSKPDKQGPLLKPHRPTENGIKDEAKTHPAIVEANRHAGALNASMKEAAKDNVEGVDDFLTEFAQLQKKYPHLFPTEQEEVEVSPQHNAVVDKERPSDYPVTPESRKLI